MGDGGNQLVGLLDLLGGLDFRSVGDGDPLDQSGVGPGQSLGLVGAGGQRSQRGEERGEGESELFHHVAAPTRQMPGRMRPRYRKGRPADRPDPRSGSDMDSRFRGSEGRG